MNKRIVLMSLFAMFLAISALPGQDLTNPGINGQIYDDKGDPYCHQPKGRGEQYPEEMVVCRLHKPQCYAFGPGRVTGN